jgi:hypothetical protein
MNRLIEIQDLKRTRPIEEIGNDFVMDMPTMDLLKLMQYHYDHKVSPRKVFIPLHHGRHKYPKEKHLVQCVDCWNLFEVPKMSASILAIHKHHCHICFPCLICSKPYSNREEFQYVYHPCSVDFYFATMPEYSNYCKLAVKLDIFCQCGIYHWKFKCSPNSRDTAKKYHYEIWRLWQQKDQTFIYWIPEEMIQQILNHDFIEDKNE